MPEPIKPTGANGRENQLLQAEIHKLQHELDRARQTIAQLQSDNQQLDRERVKWHTVYQDCWQVLYDKTGIEFYPLTREEMDEAERSGLTLDAIIEELDKSTGS
jgi:septal ring factor EnvC (AmiA/AmiB activator)